MLLNQEKKLKFRLNSKSGKNFKIKFFIFLLIFGEFFLGYKIAAEQNILKEVIENQEIIIEDFEQITNESSSSTDVQVIEQVVTMVDVGDGIISITTSTLNNLVETKDNLLQEDKIFNNILSTDIFEDFLNRIKKKDYSLSEIKDENDLDKIFTEKIFEDLRLVGVIRNKESELWFKKNKQEWQKIADKETISSDSFLGFENNIVFWTSPEKKSFIGFDTLSQIHFSQTIETNEDNIIEINSQKYKILFQNSQIKLVFLNNEVNF